MTVDLHSFLRVARKRWRLAAFFLLAGIGAAAALTWTTTPTYRASAQLFVAAADTGGDISGLQAGGQFTQQRVQSYADIVSSPEVADAAAAQLGNVSARTISREVSATAPLNTVLLNVQATDRSPQRAQAIVNAVSDQFAVFAAQLETPSPDALSPVKVTVVKRAGLPSTPVSPRKTLNLVLGALVGLALGAGAVALREALDTTVKDGESLRAELDLPVLAAIGYDRKARKQPLVVHADRHAPRAEAFRQLRTNLQFVDIDHPPRSILVTSSVPEEGKTTTAINLAIALSESGMRVALIEADLRRPKVGDYLGIEGAVGITSVLVGQCNLEDAIQPWGPGAQLSVLPSGPQPPNPSELLGSRGMATIVQDLEEIFDLVIIDAPPLLPVTDAAVLAPIVSGALVVARHGHVRKPQLAQSLQSLRAVGATVYGAVLAMTPNKGRDSYSYGYHYRYEPQQTELDEVRPEAPATVRRLHPNGRRHPSRPATVPFNPALNTLRSPVDTPTPARASGDDAALIYFRN